MGRGVYSLRSPRRLAHLSWWKLLARLPPYPQHVERPFSAFSASPSCVFLVRPFPSWFTHPPLFLLWIDAFLFYYLLLPFICRFFLPFILLFLSGEGEELPLLYYDLDSFLILDIPSTLAWPHHAAYYSMLVKIRFLLYLLRLLFIIFDKYFEKNNYIGYLGYSLWAIFSRIPPFFDEFSIYTITLNKSTILINLDILSICASFCLLS